MAGSATVRRALAGLVLALAVGGPAIAGAPDEAVKRRGVGLDYTVYFGGLKVLKLNVGLALEGARYDLEAAMKTHGFAARMFPWSLRTNASGQVDDARVRPDRAHSENLWRGKKGWTTLRFDDEGPKVISTGSKRKRAEVPPDELRGAVDVASAFLALSRVVQSGQECDTKVPVFDGKRRFNFIIARLGEQQMSRNRYSAFSGTALYCQVDMEMLHGRKRERDYGGLGSKGRMATIWIAPIFEGVPPMPVRVEYDTRWGLVVAHLSRANLSGGGGNRELTTRR